MEREFDYQDKKLELVELNEKAENVVAIASAAAAVTGAIPIPFADAPVLIAEQVAMMGSICAIYEIDIEKDGLSMLATTAIATSTATVVGKTAANLLKFIPIVGQLSGGFLSGATATAVTYAIGMAFIKLCNMVKIGDLSKYDMLSSTGMSVMKDQFKKQMSISKK